MKKIRIGNDIAVTWAIYKDEKPYSLVGLDISLYLEHAFGRSKINSYRIIDNKVVWTFEGKEQEHTGNYSLVLVINENKEGMATTDQCDFVRLVPVTPCCEGYDDENVATETIELTSSVEFAPVVINTGTGGAEEIYIGKEPPTDDEYKVWINPDEQGNNALIRELYWADEEAGETLTEEQKACNAETYRMFADGLTPAVVVEGVIGSGIWYEDEELGAGVDLLFKVDWGNALALVQLCLMEDGSIEDAVMIFTEKVLFLEYPQAAQTFLENWGLVSELKGVIRTLGGVSEVDVVIYNGSRYYVEYNLHDKRYRVEFNADYTINKTIDITPAGGGDSSEVIRVRGLSTAEIFPMSLLEIYFPDNEYLQEFFKKATLTREIANGLLPLMSEAYGEEIAAQFESVFDSFFAINQAAYSKLSQKVAQGEAVSVIVEYSSILIDGGIISSVGSVISGESSGSFEVTVAYDGNIQKIVVTPRMTIFENGSVILDPPTNVVYFNTTGQLTPMEMRQNILVLNSSFSETYYFISGDSRHRYTSLWSTASNDAIGFIDENGISRVLTINDDGTSYITPPFTTSETE